MNTLAHRIATSIKRANPEQTHSIELMQYSLGIILNTLLIFIASALIGWITGILTETMLFLLSFCMLRLASGGFHLKKARACNVASILLCTVTPQFSDYFGNHLLIVNGISLIIMLIFAPNPDINSQIPKRIYPVLKVISILLVGLNFFIGSSVIGLAFLAQSFTVIPLKRRNGL